MEAGARAPLGLGGAGAHDRGRLEIRNQQVNHRQTKRRSALRSFVRLWSHNAWRLADDAQMASVDALRSDSILSVLNVAQTLRKRTDRQIATDLYRPMSPPFIGGNPWYSLYSQSQAVVVLVHHNLFVCSKLTLSFLWKCCSPNIAQSFVVAAGDLTAAPELTRAPRTTELSVEVRHSPRLARRRPGGEAATLPDDADSASITISSSKQRSSPSSSTSQSTNQCRKRRRVSSPSGRSSPLKSGVSRSGGVGSRGGRSVAPRTRSGVLVGETPRKRSAAEAAASMRTSRCGGTDNSTGGRGSHAEPAAAITVLPSSPAAPGAACATEGTGAMPLAPLQERGPPAPPDIASAAQEGRARRGRRVTHYPCPEANANANAQEAMPSPPSWRSASAASRLFVEESPSTIAGARNGCRSNEWASAGSSESGEGGISCQLMATESASPIARRRTVVPDTPVC